jgi:hypothetical protein
MQPEAGVVGPLLAIAFILGTAIFRSLLDNSGQNSILACDGLSAFDGGLN